VCVCVWVYHVDDGVVVEEDRREVGCLDRVEHQQELPKASGASAGMIEWSISKVLIEWSISRNCPTSAVSLWGLGCRGGV